MAVTPGPGICVLDDGGPSGAGLIERLRALPAAEVLSVAPVGGPPRAGVEVVDVLPPEGLTIRRVVQAAGERDCTWIMVPRHYQEPEDALVDAAVGAAKSVGPDRPGVCVVFAADSGPQRPGLGYRHVAVVADLRVPFNSGLVAWSAVALARATGARLSVLVLGADPQHWPAPGQAPARSFAVSGGQSLFEAALAMGEEVGLEAHWQAIGSPTEESEALIEAATAIGADIVVSDVRSLVAGVRIGRRKRMLAALHEKAEDRGLGLLRRAPMDVCLVLDAVEMGLMPSSALRLGAVGALALGMVSPAAVASADTGVKTAPAAHSAPARAAGSSTKQAELAKLRKRLEKERAKETKARELLKDAKADARAAKKALSDAIAAADVAQARLDELERTQEQDQGGGIFSQLISGRSVPIAQAQRKAYEAATSAAEADYQAAVDAQWGAMEASRVAEVQREKAQLTLGAVVHREEPLEVQVKKLDKEVQKLEKEAEEALHPYKIPTTGYTLTAHFGQPGSYWSSGYHTGLDFAAPVGTPIFAAGDGVVVSAGDGGAYGNYTTIQHADGTLTHYAHQNVILVSAGEHVTAGQQIGEIGLTGNTTGAHLHFEVTGTDGNFQDPAAWLGM